MHRITGLISLAFLFISFSFCNAQRGAFSQFDNAPLLLNPAQAGNFNGDYRINANYKNQNSSSLSVRNHRDIAVSQDSRLEINESNSIGVGLLFHLQRSDSYVSLQDRYSLMSSFIHQFKKNQGRQHTIAVGLNLAIGRNELNPVRFNNLSTTISTDPNNPFPGIDLTQFNSPPEVDKTTFHFSPGLQWDYSTISLFRIQLGLALDNTNNSDLYILSTETNASIRSTVHGNVQIPLFHRMLLAPTFVFYNQQSFQHLVVGMSAKYLLKKSDLSKSLQIGMWLNPDSDFEGSINYYTIGTTLKLNELSLGLSYDKHPVYSSRSSIYEFSITYLIDNSKKARIKTDLE